MLEKKQNPDNPLDCPVVSTLCLISGKWKPMIIHALIEQPMRFGKMKDCMFPISQKVLTEQLRDLERNQLVQRHISEGKILNVSYSLTSYGQSLIPVMEALYAWGELNFPCAGRQAHDRT